MVESGQKNFEAGHIPGAGYLDLQAKLSDRASPYRFTMLRPDALAAAFAAHGIGDDSCVVLYSANSLQWATRIWWMLRSIGFDDAAVLNGGWQKWQGEGRPVSTDPCNYPAASLRVKARQGLFVGKDAVRAGMGAPRTCVLNALSAELHRGDGKRYGRPGRIPGSANIPAAGLIDPDDGTLIEFDKLKNAFAGLGTAPDQKIITYCGGGIAASLDSFLLHQLGYTDVAIYDNSLSEWAKDESLPMETG